MTDNQNKPIDILNRSVVELNKNVNRLGNGLDVLKKADAFNSIYANLEKYFRKQGGKPKGNDISRLSGFVSTMQNPQDIESLLRAVASILRKEKVASGGLESATLTMDGFQRVITEALASPIKMTELRKQIRSDVLDSDVLDGVTLESFKKTGPSEGGLNVAEGVNATENAVADAFSLITDRINEGETYAANKTMQGAGAFYNYYGKSAETAFDWFDEMNELYTVYQASSNVAKRIRTPIDDLTNSEDVLKRLLDLRFINKYTDVGTSNHEALAKDQLRITLEHEGRSIDDLISNAMAPIDKDLTLINSYLEASKGEAGTVNDGSSDVFSYAQEHKLSEKSYLEGLQAEFSSESLPDESPDNLQAVLAQLHEKIDALSSQVEELQAQKAAEEKPKEGAPASVKESLHQQCYQAALKDDEEREQGATLLKAFFDELAPVTEQFGKLKEILSSLLAPEDMAALEAKTQEVAAKEGDATAQDFNGLIEMLKQLLEKVNVILDPETGLLSPKEESAPIVAPATSGGASTGSGPSTVQETQKKGEGIEAQLEAWDEIVRKFGENAVGAFENMLESDEIIIYTFIGCLLGPVLYLFGRECTQKPTFQ